MKGIYSLSRRLRHPSLSADKSNEQTTAPDLRQANGFLQSEYIDACRN